MLKKLPWKVKKAEKAELTLWEVEEYTDRKTTDVKYLYVFMTLLVIHSFAPFIAFTMFHRDIPMDGTNYPEVCAVACSIPYDTMPNQTASCPSGSEYIFKTKGVKIDGEIKINVSSPCIQDCFQLADDDAFLNFCSDNTGEAVRKLISKIKMDDQLVIVKLFHRNFTFSLIFRLLSLAFIYTCSILLYFSIKQLVRSSVLSYVVLNLVVTILILSCLIIFFNLVPESVTGIFKVENIFRLLPAAMLFGSLVYTVWMLTWARKLISLTVAMFKLVRIPIASMPCLFAINGIAMLFAGIVISLMHILIVSYYSCGVLVVIDGTFQYRKSFVLLVFSGLQVVFAWWILFFMRDLMVTVVAGSVTNWYFTKAEAFVTCSRLSPVTASMSVICKHHLGTIIAGSLFHAFDYFKVVLEATLIFARSKKWTCRKTGNCFGFIYSPTEYAPYVLTVLAGVPFFEAVEKCHELLSGIYHLRKSLVPFFFVYNTLVVSTFVGVSMFFLYKRSLNFFYPMIVFLSFTSFLVVRLISAFFTAVLVSTVVSFFVEEENGGKMKEPIVKPFIEMGNEIATKPYGFCGKKKSTNTT